MSDQSGPARTSSELDSIDRTMLTPLVRRALGRETLEITDWRCSRIQGGAGDIGGVFSGLYRFAGSGIDQGKTVSWSIILKAIGSSRSGDDPSEARYWKREILAYQSGQLDDLPGGLAAPQCFGIVERSNLAAWLWLEDLTDDVGRKWPLDHYGLVARHLGQFNGAYLTGEPLPTWSWLSQGWLRALVNRAEPSVLRLRQVLDHPVVRRRYPESQVGRIFGLWAERERFLDVLDRLPQTFCHHDAHRRNLFARRNADGSQQTVGVDWAFAGIGALGEEINPLVHAGLGFSEVEPTAAKALDEIVFNGYLAGLADAGWHGDPRVVRFGYIVASALCFCIGYSLGDGLAALLDECLHPWMEQAFGQPIDLLADLWAENDLFRLDLLEEARGLLRSLDPPISYG